jgi:hypothetical protein
LHDNPEEARRIGHTAQQWAANRFTQNRYTQKILDILSEVAPNSSSTTMRHSPADESATSGMAEIGNPAEVSVQEATLNIGTCPSITATP